MRTRAPQRGPPHCLLSVRCLNLDNRDKLMEFGRGLRERLPEPPKSYEAAKAEREKREAETGQAERGTLLKARVTRPDPLQLPPTVLQRPTELLTFLSGLAATSATADPGKAP
jgi:hypothetical protein